ncbi:hypothetical protein [Streptomyces sp. NPDC001502]|uniref:hypothetical protein n=1 Tax=Streptomyces sp. NPDC001502 TaxID=3364578 RepID=UPI0036850410
MRRGVRGGAPGGSGAAGPRPCTRTRTCPRTAAAAVLRQQAAQCVRDRAVRTAERLELARELHDLAAHHVTGIADDAGRPATLSEKARGGGYGLADVTERAEALGGSLTAGPTPDGGRLVTATLPL